MKKQDLEYILKALNYGLFDCDDHKEDKSTHYNLFANAIELVEKELNCNCPTCNSNQWKQHSKRENKCLNCNLIYEIN